MGVNNMGSLDECRVLPWPSSVVSWGAMSFGESCTSFLHAATWPSRTQKLMGRADQFVYFALLKVSCFMFKYFHSSHLPRFFGTYVKMKGMETLFLEVP